MEGGSAKERTERTRRLPVYAEAECKRIEKIINNKEKISAGEENVNRNQHLNHMKTYLHNYT